MTRFGPVKAPPDILCLYGARALRGFGDGFAILILPVYLTAIGFSPFQIGVVALSAAAGALAAALPELLAPDGWPKLGAIRLMFDLYAALGLRAILLYARLPRDHAHAENRPKAALGPSRSIVYRLAALFSLD